MNQLKIEIIADPTSEERRIEGFKQKLQATERELQQFGQGAHFGEDIARQIETIERRTLTLQRSFAGLRGPRGVFDPMQQEAGRAQARTFQLQRQLELLQRANGRGASNTYLDEMLGDALSIEETLKRLEAQERRMQSFAIGRGGGGRGPGAVGGGSGGGGDIGQGIAGGFGIPLGAGAVAAAGTAFFVAGVDKAIDKAREAADANRVLTSSATEAGLAYNDAADKAANFAKQTGLQTTDARVTFSSLLRVTQQAGRVQDIDKVQKAFADLAAARGIAAKDINTLGLQILSGQDEALNRAGLDDPSKLAARYAREHDKTVEQLTQREQVLSRLNAVMEKAAQFTGAAEDRLKTTTGQITLAEQSLGNLTTRIGESIVAGMEFRDLLRTVNDVLGSISLSSDDVAKKLKQGLTPEQIAKQQTGGATAVLDFLKGGFSIPFAGAAAFGDFTREGPEVAFSRLAAALTPGERRRKEIEDQVRAQQKILDDQKKAASDAVKASDDKQRSEEAQLAAGVYAKESITKLTTNISHEDQLQPQVEGLRKLRAELDGYVRSGQLATDVTDGFKDKLKNVDEQIYQTNKRIEEMVRTTFHDTRDFLGQMQQRIERDNPFVTLFQQADTVMERSRQRFLAYGETFVEQMAAIEMKAIDMERTALRIQQGFKVIDLQTQLRRLQFGPVAASTEDQRRLDVYGRQIDAARDIPALLEQAQAVRHGRVGPEGLVLDQGAILKQQIAAILKLRDSFTGETGYGDRAARSLLNQELVSLFQGASPELQRRLIQNRGLRGEIAGAFGGQATDRRQAIDDALRRAEASRFAVQGTEEKYRFAKQTGFEDEAARREFLVSAQGLSDTELTPKLRVGLIDALQHQERKEVQKEKEAEKRQKKMDTLLGKIEQLITEKGLKIDQDGAGVLVEVRDKSDRATVQVLGEGFK